MTDTIIKGTGNSRSIKSVPNLAALAPTWDKALGYLTGEGLPIDIGPLNPLGCDVMGTPLNKALLEQFPKFSTGSYRGTGTTTTNENQLKITLGFTPKLFFISGTSSGDRFYGGANSTQFAIFPYDNRTAPKLYCGIYRWGTPLSNPSMQSHQNLDVTFLNDGIQWWSSSKSENYIYSLNGTGFVYTYFAFG